LDLITATFNLCNTFTKLPISADLRDLLLDLNMFGEGKEVNRSDIGFLARKQNAQFYGYLFIEEKRDTLIEFYKKLPQITPREKELLLKGHSIMTVLDDLCLKELRIMYPNLSTALNPYGHMRSALRVQRVDVSDCIDKREYLETASAFKNTVEHRYLMSHPCAAEIKRMTESEVLKVVNTVGSKIADCDIHSAPTNILDFKTFVQHDSRQYHIFKFFVTVLAMREMLANMNQVLYKALIGEPFMVLNNENMLNLEKYTKNVLGESFTVLFRPSDIPYDCMGNIVLMDCQMSGNLHLHKFCRVEGTSLSFSRKAGTMLFKMREVNQSLNPFYNLCSM
jgi:hypothetical protein